MNKTLRAILRALVGSAEPSSAVWDRIRQAILQAEMEEQAGKK